MAATGTIFTAAVEPTIRTKTLVGDLNHYLAAQAERTSGGKQRRFQELLRRYKTVIADENTFSGIATTEDLSATTSASSLPFKVNLHLTHPLTQFAVEAWRLINLHDSDPLGLFNHLKPPTASYTALESYPDLLDALEYLNRIEGASYRYTSSPAQEQLTAEGIVREAADALPSDDGTIEGTASGIARLGETPTMNARDAAANFAAEEEKRRRLALAQGAELHAVSPTGLMPSAAAGGGGAGASSPALALAPK